MPKMPFLYRKDHRIALLHGGKAIHLAEAIGEIGDHNEVEYNRERALRLAGELMGEVKDPWMRKRLGEIVKTLNQL